MHIIMSVSAGAPSATATVFAGPPTVTTLTTATTAASVQLCNKAARHCSYYLYLRNLLHICKPSCHLHSASQNILHIPSCTANFGRHSFSFSTPTIRNELAAAIRESNTLDIFKWRLKRHLTCWNLPHITDTPPSYTSPETTHASGSTSQSTTVCDTNIFIVLYCWLPCCVESLQSNRDPDIDMGPNSRMILRYT